MKKNGQAAIEFLTTYGWAILVTIGVLGAIYLVVDTNAKDRIPDTCTFGDSFQCKDYKILKTGEVTLLLRNLVGSDLTIQSIMCTESGKEVVSPVGISVAAGGEVQVTCALSKEFYKKTKVDVTVVYVRTGYSYPSSSDGTVISAPTD